MVLDSEHSSLAVSEKSFALFNEQRQVICVGDGYHPWQVSNPENLGSETAYVATTLPAPLQVALSGLRATPGPGAAAPGPGHAKFT